MHQTLVKKIINCLVLFLILVTCVSCKAVKPYKVNDYLNTLGQRSGLSSGENIDETVNSLLAWGVLDNEDLLEIEEDLNHGFMSKTICKLIEYDGDYLEHLKELSFIKSSKKEKDLVDEEIALEVIEKAVNIINNKEFENTYYIRNKEGVVSIDDYDLNNNLLSCDECLNIGDNLYLENDDTYKKVLSVNNDKYVLGDSEFDKVVEELDLSGSFEINFDDSFDIPGGQLEDDTSYVNNSGRTLLSSTKSKSFTKDGFRVNYSFKRSGINARISKNVGGKNIYFDLSLTNIKPTYKWDYKDGVVNEAYFKVDYNSTEKLGVSIGKYNRYYLDFTDKDTSSVVNYLKSVIKEKDDEVEATIEICEIKTPLPDLPTVYFNIDVLAKIYASGRAELILYNDHTKGLEVKNGTLRTISDSERDGDFKLGGSARACLGLNFNLEAVDYRLMDIELDAGVRAAVSSTLHLYDSDGNINSVKCDEIPYSTLDDIAQENKDIKVCGDVSLNWVLDIYLNTYKTLLHKFALWTKKSILDGDNQVFGNLTHIENGVFVKSCTRKKRFNTSSTTSQSFTIDKIILSKHSAVINIGDSYNIEVTNLPSGYKLTDLVYKSSDESIATVSNGTVKAIQKGSCEISVTTKDGKYNAAISILVSTG